MMSKPVSNVLEFVKHGTGETYAAIYDNSQVMQLANVLLRWAANDDLSFTLEDAESMMRLARADVASGGRI
jgi:hypothetical protein